MKNKGWHPVQRALLIILLILCAVVISFTTIDYVGKTYAKTDHVEIFFSTDEIKREYEVIGQIKAEASEVVKFEVMEQQLVKNAMVRGADAILIGELKTVEVGSVSSASGKTYGDPHYYLDNNMKRRFMHIYTLTSGGKKHASDFYWNRIDSRFRRPFGIVFRLPNCPGTFEAYSVTFYSGCNDSGSRYRHRSREFGGKRLWQESLGNRRGRAYTPVC